MSLSRTWGRKRFYKNALAQKSEDGYSVHLDHRSLRTPLRKPFVVPTEGLAVAVAQEWGVQGTIIQQPLMHLTALCNTVIDQPTNRPKDEVIGHILSSLSTDTLCYHADEPDDLVLMQQREWGPILEWFNGRFNLALSSTTSLFQLSSVDQKSLKPLATYLSQLSPWALTGLEHCVDCSKSVVLSVALFEGRLDAEEAANLALLETRHQTQRWGSVEWQHDIEAQDLKSRMAATQLVASLS
eukprot:Em0020g1057a